MSATHGFKHAVCLALLAPLLAQAADVQYATGLGLGHTDNIRRTPTNEQGEDVGRPSWSCR